MLPYGAFHVALLIDAWYHPYVVVGYIIGVPDRDATLVYVCQGQRQKTPQNETGRSQNERSLHRGELNPQPRARGPSAMPL